MMKRYVFFFGCVFITGLVGCSLVDEPEQDRQVMIKFSAASLLSGSSLKLAASQEEDLFTKVILFAVDDQNEVKDTFILKNPSLSGTSCTLPREIKLLYAIANPSPEIENEEPETVSDLNLMTCDFTLAPYSPFLMSGIGEITDESSVSITLVRAIAKINIVNNDHNFVIESITVNDTPAKGYVFDVENRPPLIIETTTYSYSGNSSVYVAENSQSELKTEFVVTGQYQDQPIIHTFHLTKDDGQDIDIVRNNCYHVDICFESDD